MMRRRLLAAVLGTCLLCSAPALGEPQLKKGVAQNVAGFMNFLKVIQELAGSVKQFAKGAAQGVEGGAGELIRVALDGLLLKGIPDPNIRGIVSSAIGAIASQLSKPGFSLTQAVMAVLRALANDPRLGELIASTIQIRELKPVIQSGLKAIFGRLASPGGVRSVMSNPFGFLTEVAVKLIDDVKGKVADIIVGLVKAEPALRASVKANVIAAIDALKAAIQKKSFSELLNFGKALAVIVTQAIYDQFVGLLRKNVPAAKAKLQELAAKLPLPAQVKSLVDAVVAGLGAGATQLANDVSLCRRMITGLDAESVKGVFQCLKVALASAVGKVGDVATGGGDAEASPAAEPAAAEAAGDEAAAADDPEASAPAEPGEGAEASAPAAAAEEAEAAPAEAAPAEAAPAEGGEATAPAAEASEAAEAPAAEASEAAEAPAEGEAAEAGDAPPEAAEGEGGEASE